ncbi:MAG: type II toxin-antitoxin system RelE/ParE family toxin [Candidatus Tectomicrobia bacterium]|uniref:Type II toxin-antitoxin system RelE/ParE family toxin n=1 Tax=Tectimicrobiota bacterium TaxID=2528274 RepID=A0A932M0C6_UNCTE|nr:type II toxin-antitoxin system RelE/ParE family toxin [Candidatus Tectomicrobia bacterium]
MPPIKVRFHPAAAAEVETARQWYAERSPLAARAFLAEMDLSVERVRGAPQRWPRYVKRTRRYMLPRFPFSVIYRVQGQMIEVVAVAHQRRKPGYWQSR